MLQAVGGRQPNIRKAAKVAKPRTIHVLPPCKDENSSIISWLVMLLLLLLTFPLFVHFIDIHDCHMPQRLITPIETVMCQDVSQQTEGPLNMARRLRAADKKKTSN